VFEPYALETLLSSALLSAGHAHVSYRFHVADYAGRYALQIMLLNWDVYIRGPGAPEPRATRNDDVSNKLNGSSADEPVYDPRPAVSASTMLPCVKLMYRFTDLAAFSDVAEPASQDSSSAEAPAPVSDRVRQGNLSEAWASVMGAQRMVWGAEMLLDAARILARRQTMLPGALRDAGAAKGFAVSYLLRMTAFPCEDLARVERHV
jgi:hypothetical protein